MKLTRYILFTLWALMAAACASEQEPLPIEVERTGAYVRLNIVVPVTSRANPTGGDTGDGEEVGTENENSIENLTLFFYSAPDGLCADEDTPINSAVYVGSGLQKDGVGSVSKTIQLDRYIPASDDRILVCANAGDLTALTTLGQVRDYIINKPFKAGTTMSEYKAFTMANASAFDGRIMFSDDKGDLDGSRERPFGASVLIERTAARIDLWLDNSTTAPTLDKLNYVVDNNDRVALENIVVINSMQPGSYLLKRVTESVSDDYSCFDLTEICGNEKMNGSGRTLNYVVEPHTILKDGTTADDILEAWYGSTRAKYIEDNYTDIFGSSNSLLNYLPYSFLRSDGSGKRAITLAYVNENTQHMSQHKAMYATGLAIRATYTPASLYTDAAATNAISPAVGTTFYRYEAVAKRDKAAEVLYFSNSQAAGDYRDAHPADNATIEEYPNGVCYYHLWIRHANIEDGAGQHQCIPMEYGIVRNNVYCLRLSFVGPGTPTPELTDPENVQAEIYVRNWNLRTQSEIIM